MIKQLCYVMQQPVFVALCGVGGKVLGINLCKSMRDLRMRYYPFTYDTILFQSLMYMLCLYVSILSVVFLAVCIT